MAHQADRHARATAPPKSRWAASNRRAVIENHGSQKSPGLYFIGEVVDVTVASAGITSNGLGRPDMQPAHMFDALPLDASWPRDPNAGRLQVQYRDAYTALAAALDGVHQAIGIFQQNVNRSGPITGNVGNDADA